MAPLAERLAGYGLLATLTVLAVFLPFYLLGGGPWIAASFTSLLKHDAWSTIWAIMDNVWQYTGVGPASAHLNLAQAGAAATHPSLIPGWVTLGIFAVGYAVFFFRPIRKPGVQHYIWFSTLTAMGLHLWSKDWSPQWAVALVPLFLLSFPDRLGVGLTLCLTAAAFMEWPVAGVFHSQPLLVAAILIRTALFIGVGVLTVQRLWFGPADAVKASPHPAENN